jgi:glycosyltransferase involved in cell wall biosynthesis
MKKVAIVHEWFEKLAGSERVVEQILKIYPQADLFALVDFMTPEQKAFIQHKPVNVSFLQHMPLAQKAFRSYLPLMPLAIEQFDLSAYDLIISSNHAVAKGVVTGPDQLHICYCHSPMRYVWDLQHQYLQQSKLDSGFKTVLARPLLHYMRLWDCQSASRVNHFVANSHFIRRRIEKVYNKPATVIYPPVAVADFTLSDTPKEGFYLAASRLVPYKFIDLIVKAFAHMPEKKLVVIGDGPDKEKVLANAQNAPNIQFLGEVPFSTLKDYLQRAKAFLHAAIEDFGIFPVEAQACGTPVIAFGKGGLLETVKDLSHEKPTGVFFQEQTTESIAEAVALFEANSTRFKPEHCRENAITFSNEHFRATFYDFCESSYEAFVDRSQNPTHTPELSIG